MLPKAVGVLALAGLGATTMASAVPASGTPTLPKQSLQNGDQAPQAPPEATESSRDWSHEELRYREVFGLSIDPAHLAEIYADDAQVERSRARFNVALTDAEMAAVGRQWDIQNALARNYSEIAGRVGPGFAGLWIDQAKGGEVTIATTDSRPVDVQDLVTPDAIVLTRQMEHSLAYLTESKEAISQRLSADSRFEQTRVSVDIRANALLVSLPEGTRELPPDIAAVTTAPINIDTAGPVVATDAEGGERIDRASTANEESELGLEQISCTSSPVAGDEGALFVLTAGHCEDTNSPWTGAITGINWYGPGADLFGPAARNAIDDVTQADAAAITIAKGDLPADNCIHFGSNGCVPVVGAKDPVLGSATWRNGFAGGLTFGHVQNANVDIDGIEGPNNPSDTYEVEEAFTTDNNLCPGDSGGPVFGDTGNGGVVFYGIVAAGTTPDGGCGWHHTVASRWTNIKAELGVLLVDVPSNAQ